MKKSFREILSLGCIGILYIFSVIKANLLPMHVPVKVWQMLLFAVGAFLFYLLVDTRIGRIVFLSAVGLGLGILAYQVIDNGFEVLSEIFEPVTKLVQVMIQIGTGYYNETISDAWLMWSVGIFALVIAMPVYFFLVRWFRFYLLIIPGLAFFMTVWGIVRHVDPLSFYIFITVAIVTYIRHNYLQHRKMNSETAEASGQGGLMLHFIPMALVIILFSTAFTVELMPIQWPWLDEKINNIYWDLHAKYSIDRYDKFSLASTGFGDPSRLGGPVRADNTPIMLVHAPTRVYLRGAVYDQYTGTGWVLTERAKENYLVDRVSDQQEFRFGWKAAAYASGMWTAEQYEQYLRSGDVPSVTRPENRDYISFLQYQQIPQMLFKLYPEEELSVRHQNVRTQSLFTPLKMFVPITGLPGFQLEEKIDGVFEADRRLPGDSTYSLNYLQPAYGMRELDYHFYASRPEIYKQFNAYNTNFIQKLDELNIPNVENVKKQLINDLEVYSTLERHSREIHELYMQLPEGVTERVLQMAQGITMNSYTTYGKLKIIEAFLRQNYVYNLYPQIPPSNQDFVDYFLFDAKEGYCSYYASAMCIMARAVGIPARYVEGFVMPEKPDDNGFYHVTNQNAHAWVEVYLEGAGWVTMEPTAPMAGAMNFSVDLSEAVNGEYAEAFMPEEFDLDQFMRDDDFSIDLDMSDLNQKTVTSVDILIMIVAGILSVMLLNLLFAMIRSLFLSWLDPKKSVPYLYHHLTSLLAQAGCPIRNGETPKDYAQRVDSRFQFVNMTMSELVDVFYSVRFGAHPLDKKTVKRLLAFLWEAKTKSGRTMYFMKRFLLRGLLFQG